MSLGVSPQILLISAPDEVTLDRRAKDLADSVEAHPHLGLSSIAWWLQTRDRRSPERRAYVCTSREVAISALRGFEPRRTFTGVTGPSEVVFMFPGYGAQFLGMGAGLHSHEAAFREAFDECCSLLKDEFDLRAIVHAPEANSVSARAALRQARIAEPAIFAVSYALARLWMSWGLRPAACVGYGVGEFVAATIAGVFTLPDALRIVAARAALVQEQSPGAMIAVRLSATDASRYLSRHVSLAAMHGPELTILSGSEQAISLLELELAADLITARRLDTSHAFQSPLMDPMAAPLADCIRGIGRRKPNIPICSSISGGWLTDAEAQDPQYWSHQARKTVRFSAAVERLLSRNFRNFVECGPGQTLTPLLRHHDAPQCTAVACLRESVEETSSVRAAAAALWTRGVELDWKVTYQVAPIEEPGFPDLLARPDANAIVIGDDTALAPLPEVAESDEGADVSELELTSTPQDEATAAKNTEEPSESSTSNAHAALNISLEIDADELLCKKAAELTARMNVHLESCEVPMRWEHFGAVYFLRIPERLEAAKSSIFPRLRQRGVHLLEHLPCVVKPEHSEQDLSTVASAFGEVINELIVSGELPGVAILALSQEAVAREEVSITPPEETAIELDEIIAPIESAETVIPEDAVLEITDLVPAEPITVLDEPVQFSEEANEQEVVEEPNEIEYLTPDEIALLLEPEPELEAQVVDEPPAEDLPPPPIEESAPVENAPEPSDAVESNEPAVSVTETAPEVVEPEPAYPPLEWIGSKAEYPALSGLDSLFEDVAAQQPDAVAVTDGKRHVTYDALNTQANMLADRLLASGIRPGSLIGVCLERGVEAIASTISILKIGCVYVPLDPSWPGARLKSIAKESACATVITKLDHARHFGGHATLLDGPRHAVAYSAENPAIPTNGAAMACVLFLSDSISRPKGVAIPNRALTRLAFSRDAVPLSPIDVFAHGSSPSSEAALLELWGPLVTGGRIVVVPRSTMQDGTELGALIRDEGITAMFVTSGLLNQFAAFATGIFRPLHHLLVGGDVLNPRMIARVLRHGAPRRLVHVFGFAETGGFACALHISEPPITTSISIGRPLANVQAHILDERLRAVPVGEPGELYIGGNSLALGYYSNPQASAEFFVPKPSEPGARLFRTGDRARWLDDGTIELLGRTDDQVIVRGHRIRLSQLETEITRHPKVREAAVQLLGAGAEEKALAAHFVRADNCEVEPEEIRAFLRRSLPEHMVPITITPIDHIPRASNGAVHRSVLPISQRAVTVSVVPPLNPIEARVAEAMALTLGLPSVGGSEDFFQLGGTKLLAMDLLARLRKLFGIDVPAEVLLESPTVREVARFITEHRPKAVPEMNFRYLVPIQRGEPGRAPLFVIAGGWGGEEELHVFAELARLVDPDLPVFGFKARGAGTAEPPHANATEMAADYLEELSAIQPCGPYRIAGEGVGGICAHEMACQLREAGEFVAELILLNTTVPSPDVLADFLAQNADEREPSAIRPRNGLVLHSLEKMTSTVAGKVRGLFGRNLRGSEKREVPTPATQHPRGIAEYPITLLNHRLRKYAGRVTLFVDAESTVLLGQLGWENVAVGDLDVHTLPGDRTSYLREESTQAAEKLRAVLSGSLLPL